MSDEEKKAIEDLKGIDITYFVNGHECANFYLDEADKVSKEIELILNLIEKQQKELNNLKEIEQAHKTDNGLLRQELDMQIEHNKELEATLKQTQDSWFEDTQKLEQEKEKNNNLIKQLQEQNTEIQDISRQLRQEKEKTPESVRKQFETYQNRICELEEKNKELEEKCKEVVCVPEGTCFVAVPKNMISKDKIKEKMKEIMNYTYMSSEERQQQNYAYDRLKELLEEK